MTQRWTPPGWHGVAGAGRADISPPAGIRAHNWGASIHEISTGLHRPLTLTALAFATAADAEPVVLITADLGWWRRPEDERRVREAVLRTHGLSADRLMLHLIHTHAGPSICSDDTRLPGGQLVPAYLDFLGEAAADATRTALATLAPASMVVATGRCSVAVSRDLPCGDRYAVGFNPDVPADDTLLAAQIRRPDGATVATVVNYACHPTTLAWENSLISPDFVGAARETVEAATDDAPCLFLQGASGDLSPREQYTGDVATADRHGAAIGHAALSALKSTGAASLEFTGLVESGAPLAVWRAAPPAWPSHVRAASQTLDMPAKPLPSIDELERRWAHLPALARAERLARAAQVRASYTDGATHPLWVFRLGDAFVVGHPGEAFSWLQTQLRAEFAPHPVFVLNLVNSPGGVYLPPRDFYPTEAYQVWQTTLGPGALERLGDAAAQLIRSMLAE